jgi:hypothetical protein
MVAGFLYRFYFSIPDFINCGRMSAKLEFGSVGNAPMLVSFHQGACGEANDSIKLSVLQKGDGKKRKRIVKGTTAEMTYRGSDFGDDSMKHNCSAYAVGLVDETTGTLTVFPADHIFVMKPEVSSKSAGEGVAASKDTHFARKQELAEAFGSSKKQRAILAAQSNIISVDNIAGAGSVETAMASAAASAREGAAAGSASENASAFMNAASDALELNRQQLLPPYNQAEGLSVEELYPAEGIVPGKVQSSLEIYYKETLCAEAEGEGKDLAQVGTWVEALRSSDAAAGGNATLRSILTNSGAVLKSKHQRKQLVARCVYLQALIAFYAMLSGSRDRVIAKEDFKARVERPGMGTNVVQHIADSFSTFRRYKGQPAFSATKALL